MRRTLLAAVFITTSFATVFTEGGTLEDMMYTGEYDYPRTNVFFDESKSNDRIPVEKWYPTEDSLYENDKNRDESLNEDGNFNNENLERILEELEKFRKGQENKENIEEIPVEVEIELQKPKKEKEKLKGSEKLVLTRGATEEEPLVAQKKGQNEFVSFVEPVEAKQTKSVATLEKRRLVNSSEFSSAVPMYNSNLLMIALGTVLLVGMTVSVVGGGYYIKRRRSSTDDSDYAPYAGTGPGFKKNKGDKGDETLAYKAQLHQYQQAKQKIICGEDAPAGFGSDGEDDGAEDENNFSVYECPGLAPTGDIEVCNPNFAAHP